MDSTGRKKNSGTSSASGVARVDDSSITFTSAENTTNSVGIVAEKSAKKPRASFIGFGRLTPQIRTQETEAATRLSDSSMATTRPTEGMAEALPTGTRTEVSATAKGAEVQPSFMGLGAREASEINNPAFLGLNARQASGINASSFNGLNMRQASETGNSSFLGIEGVRAGEPLPSMLSENEGGELEIRVAFESMPSNKHSYEYFCTADPLISEEYKQKLEAAIKSNDFKALDELDNELREAYKSQEQQTKFAGFKIVRKDGLGRKTNLPGAAKRIEIETRGLSSKNIIRLPLKNGEYLELGLDENGNFSGKAVPLTKEGSNLRRAVSPKEGDPNIVYNRYDTVLSDLQVMADIKMNGVDILPNIIRAIEQQKAQFMSNTVEPEFRSSNDNISQFSNSAASQSQSTNPVQQTENPNHSTDNYSQANTPQANAAAGGLGSIAGPDTPVPAGSAMAAESCVEQLKRKEAESVAGIEPASVKGPAL